MTPLRRFIAALVWVGAVSLFVGCEGFFETPHSAVEAGNAALATDEESSSTRGLVLSQRLADAEERLLAAGSPAMRGGSPRVAPEPATGSEGTSASSGRDSGPSDRSGGVGPRDGAMPRPPRQFMSPRPPSSPVPVGRAELQRVDRV